MKVAILFGDRITDLVEIASLPRPGERIKVGDWRISPGYNGRLCVGNIRSNLAYSGVTDPGSIADAESCMRQRAERDAEKAERQAKIEARGSYAAARWLDDNCGCGYESILSRFGDEQIMAAATVLGFEPEAKP